MLAGQVYSTISCMLKGILFSPTICSLSEVGGFLDAEELHLSLCSISHSGIYGVYRARCFTHGPALYHGSPLALHPKHYATFQHVSGLLEGTPCSTKHIDIFASFLLCLPRDIMFVACSVLSPSFQRQKLLHDTHNRLCDSMT